MKAQLKFQKIICLVMLIVGALGIVYSLIYLTGSVAQLKQHLDHNYTPYKPAFEGADYYIDIQPFNTLMFYLSIGMVAASVLLYITACNKRRKYYITNYVAIGACALYDIVVSIILLVMNLSWKSKFLTDINFDAWKAVSDNRVANGLEATYSKSTVMFDLAFLFYGLIIVASLLLVFNLVWKIMCERKEKALLNGAQLKGGVQA